MQHGSTQPPEQILQYERPPADDTLAIHELPEGLSIDLGRVSTGALIGMLLPWILILVFSTGLAVISWPLIRAGDALTWIIVGTPLVLSLRKLIALPLRRGQTQRIEVNLEGSRYWGPLTGPDGREVYLTIVCRILTKRSWWRPWLVKLRGDVSMSRFSITLAVSTNRAQLEYAAKALRSVLWSIPEEPVETRALQPGTIDDAQPLRQ